jgi:zona occludens toxin
MIYLITGAPGSGKTLYAVSTLVQSLLSEKLVHEGVEIERRLCVDNVPNLLLPHELMAPGKLVEGTVQPGDGDGLWNWHKWCKPGDVIFVDEVQRHWRTRGMGTKLAECVAMLETHRHLGVDFVIVTQNPMLLDSNVRRLVGRHQHIRRMLGMQRAAVYDWDTCCTALSLRSATATSYFSYPKSAYALYKSSELHTKQRQKIPAWAAIPVLGLVGALFLAPQAYSTISGAATGKGVTKTVTTTVTPAAIPPGQLPALSVPSSGAVGLADSTPVVLPAVPVVAGCIVVGERCGCMDDQGVPVEVTPAFCSDKSGAGRAKPVEFPDSPVARAPDPSEVDALRFAFGVERPRAIY